MQAPSEPASAPSPQKEPANLTYAERVRMGAAKKAQEKAAATSAAATSEAPAAQPRRPQPAAASQPVAASNHAATAPLADADSTDISGCAPGHLAHQTYFVLQMRKSLKGRILVMLKHACSYVYQEPWSHYPGFIWSFWHS